MALPASRDTALARGAGKAPGSQTEHELRAINERLEHALEAARIGIWDWYPASDVLVASPVTKALLGYASDEPIDSMESYWSRLHADDREPVEAATRALLQGHEEEDLEHRIVWPNGEVRWVLVKGRLERDDQGRPLRMSGTILDVTARKRDEWATRLFADAAAGMTSLDTAACVRGMARAVASRFADWVLVHVRGTDGGLLTDVAASRHVSPAVRAIVRDLWTRHVTECLDRPDDAPPSIEAYPAMLQYIDPRSSMHLPLRVRGQPVGAFTVARSREGSARFDERDLATLSELARRISARLENVFLFQAEQRERARFQALVEATSHLVWTADIRGASRADTSRWHKFSGIPPRESLATGGVELVHPEDRARALDAWHQAVATGSLYDEELRLLQPDGHYRWMSVRATPVRDAEGKVIEWVGITVDVQERRETRARLEASEARYRRIVETANEGIVTLDLDGNVTFANGRMAEMLDTTVQALVGRSVFDFFFPEDVPAARQILRDRAAGVRDAGIESRLRSVAGRELWTRRASTPFAGASGRIEGSLSVVADITEAKRAERYRGRYELLARHAHDVVMFLRPTDGRILEANDAAARAYGYSHAELLGLTIADIRAPETRSELPEHLRLAAGGGQLLETTHMRKDGTRFPVEVSARGTSLEGEPVILAVTRDITARRRAEDERVQTDRFRELFIGMLGHDLRNPLSAVLTGTALLLRRAPLSEGDTRTLRRIHTSGQRMARMIEQLLDFTRARLGSGIPIQRRSVDLNEVLSHVVDELGAAHHGAKVALERCGETRGDWDGDRLAQVFSNLIHNAIEHGSGESARVTLSGAGPEVVVQVHNGGNPIAPELLPVVFDPFRRAREHGDGKKSGLGLGLYISQQIVAAHGGRIRVESSAEEGTTFEVTLPRAPPDA